MAERTRIGLIFSYDENWIGGAYYVLNIIHALKTVNDDLKPYIVLLTQNTSNFNRVVKETNYPYLSFCKFPIRGNYSIIERVVNKISRILLNKNIVVKKGKAPDIDFLYPREDPSIQIEALKKVNWIPDFQEEFLPHFFSKEEVAERKKHQQEVVCKGDVVVFSSKNARNHYQKLYPNAKAKTVVINFVVTHPDISNQNIERLKEKYNLPTQYFFAPNQFWAHKNHKVVLEAIKNLKNEGENSVVAFSGKENDPRNEKYVDELKEFISLNNLQENIIFLGFIDRAEQLCILQHSIAVIQPSLFEGWSTVVEDAKAKGKYIVLSNLEVHKEQIQNNCSFFNPTDATELSKILKQLSLNNPKNPKNTYQTNVSTFAQNFLNLVNQTKIQS